MKIELRKHVNTVQPKYNYSTERHRHINRTNNLHYRCKLARINRKFHLEILVALVIFNLIESILGNPVFVDNPSIAQFQSGRNIRHLPCIVRKSGLSGTCMFAIDCIKQNGTHLGTCIDRFYFGSCCQIKEDIPFHAQDISDNSVDQNTISHYIHESSTNVPHTSALFKLTNATFIGNSESLMKNDSTNLGVSLTTPIPIQNRESPTKPQKISIELMTTNKPNTKNNTTGNFSTISIPESSSPSTLTSLIDLLAFSLINNDSITESVSMSFNASETSATPNILSQVAFANDSLTFESSSNHSSSFPLLTSALPLQTTTTKPLQTSTKTNFVLTTTKSTEKPFNITTEEPKFSTFQVVETTTSSTSLVTQSSSYSPTTLSLQKISTTTTKSSSKKPTIITNATNKPFTTKRNTTQRTKITRRPIISTKPTVSLTAVSLSTRKPPPTKNTTIRIQQSNTTRRTTAPPKRPPIKRPTTTSTLRPKPITKRPATIVVTTLPKIDATNVKNVTGKPIQNATLQNSSGTPKPTTKSTTTQLPLVPAATKAPRPKPKPTANIVKVSPTTTSEIVTEIISTVAPSSVAVTIKPLLITGKPLTTKPLPTTHHTEKTSSTVLSNETVTSATPTLWQILNNISNKPTITEATITTESTTLKPSGLITWTNLDTPSNNNTDNNDWVPRPPPDWVLLPTIKPDGETNKTVQTTLPPKQNVGTTVEFPNNSEGLQTSPPNIVTFTTIQPETISQLTNLLNQSSTEGLPDLITETSLNSSTTPVTTDNINSGTTLSTPKPPQIPFFDGLDYKQICGKRMFPEPRIVGGANAAFGRWPWQISLRQWRTSTYLHKCGAALLNENWSITAAHCVDNVPPSDLLLRLGEYDLAEEDEPYSYQERRVQIVASHPQFDPRTFEYDLALLRFYEPVTFQPNIIPICVPDNDYDFLEQTAYVTGWGRLYEDGPLPSVLQEVSVPVINNTICETMYRAAGYIEHIPHIFICAGWKKGGYDSCEGDSGGPMVLQRDDKRFVLGGVISWGIGCAEPNQPGVYTRISEFRDWINQILQF